jgi:hypothetical protein
MTRRQSSPQPHPLPVPLRGPPITLGLLTPPLLTLPLLPPPLLTLPLLPPPLLALLLLALPLLALPLLALPLLALPLLALPLLPQSLSNKPIPLCPDPHEPLDDQESITQHAPNTDRERHNVDHALTLSHRLHALGVWRAALQSRTDRPDLDADDDEGEEEH